VPVVKIYLQERKFSTSFANSGEDLSPREKILNFVHCRGEDLQERKFSTSCAAVVKIYKSGILCQ
jgi:hypothetical protein